MADQMPATPATPIDLIDSIQNRDVVFLPDLQDGTDRCVPYVYLGQENCLHCQGTGFLDEACRELPCLECDGEKAFHVWVRQDA